MHEGQKTPMKEKRMMNRMNIRHDRFLPGAVLMLFLLAGCVSVAELEPAPGADELAGRVEGAAAESGGVRVEAVTDAWPGRAEVLTEVTPYPFSFDSEYYGFYNDYWRNIELPTQEMLDRALPEGSLEDGGRVEGFVYFEKVDPDQVERVVFRFDLIDAQTGGIFGTLSIPFVVKEG